MAAPRFRLVWHCNGRRLPDTSLLGLASPPIPRIHAVSIAHRARNRQGMFSATGIRPRRHRREPGRGMAGREPGRGMAGRERGCGIGRRERGCGIGRRDPGCKIACREPGCGTACRRTRLTSVSFRNARDDTVSYEIRSRLAAGGAGAWLGSIAMAADTGRAASQGCLVS
jgi:hypothetical protein